MKYRDKLKSPLIGISATLLPIESGRFMGRERTAIGHDYIEAIQRVGGVPLVLPIIEDLQAIEQQMECVDGLLLSGGYDVSPLLYDEEPKQKLEAVRPERDAYELQLLQLARAHAKPILGICRGLQLLNIAFGGTLHQDIENVFPLALQHNQKAKPEEAMHTVTLVPETRFQQIMETDSLLTNSFHHQAIKDLAPGLKVNAYSQDHIIEGIEALDTLFILGVQWHPELMFKKHTNMLKLFHAFVEAAR